MCISFSFFVFVIGIRASCTVFQPLTMAFIKYVNVCHLHSWQSSQWLKCCRICMCANNKNRNKYKSTINKLLCTTMRVPKWWWFLRISHWKIFLNINGLIIGGYGPRYVFMYLMTLGCNSIFKCHCSPLLSVIEPGLETITVYVCWTQVQILYYLQ